MKPLQTDAQGAFETTLPRDWEYVDASLTDVDSQAQCKPQKNDRKKEPLELAFDSTAVASADAVRQYLAQLREAIALGAEVDALASVDDLARARAAYLDEHPDVRQEVVAVQRAAKLALARHDTAILAELNSRPVTGSRSRDWSALFALVPGVVNRDLALVFADDVSLASRFYAPMPGPDPRPAAAISSFFERVSVRIDDERLPPTTTRGVNTNTWRIGARYASVSQALTSTRVELACDCPQSPTGFTRNRLHDALADIGGPLRRDRVSLTGVVQYRRDDAAQPGTDPGKPGRSETGRLFARVGWKATDTLSIAQSYDATLWTRTDSPSIANPFDTLAAYTGTRSAVTIDVTHVRGTSIVWNATLAGLFAPHDRAAANRAAPWRHDLTTGLSRGGSYGVGAFTSGQLGVSGGFSQVANVHQIRVNARVNRRTERAAWAYPGGVNLYDEEGRASFAYIREPGLLAGHTREAAATVDDNIRLGARLTVHAGAGYRHGTGISPDARRLDLRGEETAETIRGRGRVFVWHRASGRVGTTVRLKADGSLVLNGQWERGYRDVDPAEIAALHPGNTPLTLAYFDSRTNRYTDVAAVIDPAVNLSVSGDLAPPRTDVFHAGVEWHRRNGAISVRYSRLEGRDLVGWRDGGGTYGQSTLTLDDGRTIPLLPLTGPTAARRFELTNPEGWFATSNALIVSGWTRRFDPLFLSTSYVFSRTEGLTPSSGMRLGERDPELIPRFGQDPNDVTNAAGLLPEDRTHRLIVSASYTVPRFALDVAATYQHATGAPYAAFINVRLPQGTQQIFVERPGTRRFAAQNLVDVRVTRSFARRRVELFAHLLNALDDTAETDVITGNLRSMNFGMPSRFLEPRRLFAGIRLTR